MMELSLNPAAKFSDSCANNIKYILFTYLINIYSIPQDSALVHSSLNSRMALFHQNELPPWNGNLARPSAKFYSAGIHRIPQE